MRVFTIEGIEVIHITEFASLCHRTVTSTRHLLEDGNNIRKMKYFRDRSRLLIPVAEITGYPLVDSGPGNTDKIYHYKLNTETNEYERVLCPECSFGEKCEARKTADALIMPVGDA